MEDIMDFNIVLNKRKSARTFESKSVEMNNIYKIIKSASVAPSAKNRQPWKFFILNDIQKNEISKMLLNWVQSNRKNKTSAKGTAYQIMDADKMIMVYKNKYKSKLKKEQYTMPDYLSIGCALENMSLEAVNLGLGSCILCDTLYIDNEINDYLNISNLEQICGFIVGYPIYDYDSKQKKELQELLLN